jgi:hypothetical protein
MELILLCVGVTVTTLWAERQLDRLFRCRSKGFSTFLVSMPVFMPKLSPVTWIPRVDLLEGAKLITSI